VSEPGKLKRKRTMSRQEAAAWLSILAEALRAGATIDVDLAGERVTLQPTDEIRTEIELKSLADKEEIEIELTWSPTPASEATAAAGASAKPYDGGITERDSDASA
jgi:amphi-Trp domain-containing protein